MQYLIQFYNRPETASDILSVTFVGPIVGDKFSKFRDPRLNRSREILPEAVRGGIFNGFFKKKTSIVANWK